MWLLARSERFDRSSRETPIFHGCGLDLEEFSTATFGSVCHEALECVKLREPPSALLPCAPVILRRHHTTNPKKGRGR